ncbi:10146_t:CDS:2, partial [Funneliformis caledonium]
TNFWTEIQNLEEEKNAIRTALLGHLNVFGKMLTQYANRIESTNLPTNFHYQPEVQQELRESSAEFNTMRIENQDYHENYSRLLNNNIDIITNITDDYLQEAVEFMVRKVGSGILKVDNVNLEEIFEKYHDECKSGFDLCHNDIMDLRPTSQLTKIIPEATWEKFILDSYPNHKILEKWEELIQKNSEDLVIKDTLYNILSPYVEAFKAPFNIIKSGDLKEKQYSSQFMNSILKNTLNTICSIDWRILEVPIRSSKYRCNSNIDLFVNTVLSAKRTDGLTRQWQIQKETFVYKQTGGPDVDDVTNFYVHDYKLVRTMHDILNQRIILQLNDGVKDCNNLANFGALGISFMKENTRIESRAEQKMKLLSKRKIHTVMLNLPTPNRTKKQTRRQKN